MKNFIWGVLALAFLSVAVPVTLLLSGAKGLFKGVQWLGDDFYKKVVCKIWDES